jgi:Protein of unknown function, DUF481
VPAGDATSEGSAALSEGTTFNTELTSKLDFNYDYRFQLTSLAAGRYNHHMLGKFKLELTDRLDLKLSLIWDRIKYPATLADGTTPLSNDDQLVLGVGYEF